MARRKRKAKTVDTTLDIVIPVYNQTDYLRRCLLSLQEAVSVPVNVIVVDDGSSENVQTVVREVYREARYIRKSKNEGFPAAVQTGVAAGRSPFVVLINSDVTMQAGSLDTLLNTFSVDVPQSAVDMPTATKIGIVAPKLVFPRMTEHGRAGAIQHAGIALDHHFRPFHLFLGWGANHPKANERRSVQAVSGAVMMFRRQVWRDVSRIAEPMSKVYGRGTFEDVEFCLLARHVGYRVVYEPNAVGEHEVGASAMPVGGYNIKRNYEIFRARMADIAIWDAWYQV